MLLTSGITTTATSMTIDYVPVTMTKGVLLVDEGLDTEERIGFNGVTNNGDGTATLTDLSRGLSYTAGGYTEVTANKKQHIAGATVRLVSAHEVFNKIAFLDVANTFAALQTFSAGLTMSGTTAGIQHAIMTTAQRDTWGATNGRQVYNSTVGQMQWVEGGAWVTNAAGGSVADASTTVAGKVEEGTVAEQGSATATGGTGARLFVAVANLIKTSAGAADENKLCVMNSAGVLDASAGGTGVRNPTSGNLLLGAGSSAMTLLAPGTSGNVATSNGSTWTSAAPTVTIKVVYLSGTNSTALTNPTSDTAFDTHTYSVPANEIVAGAGYEFEAAFTGSIAAGNLNIGVGFGSTSLVMGNVQSSSHWTLKGFLVGTAAAGAAVAVRGMVQLASGSITAGDAIAQYTAVNFATNGGLTLKLFARFSVSNGGNNITCHMAKFTRISSTAF